MTTTVGTKADDIALDLEELIVSGQIAPGSVLRQEQLSEQYQVSRTPIREALRRLAALGLVSFEPNKGVRVRTLERDELREAFLVRAELESLATELAVPRIDAEGLAALDEAETRFSDLTLELRRRAREGTQDGTLLGELGAANHAFHDVIYTAATRRWSSASRRARAGASSRTSSGRRGSTSTTCTSRTTCSTARSARRSRPGAPTARGSSHASTCSRAGGC